MLVRTTAFLLALASCASATAQDWQGQVELRGNYYYERSTRVVAPEVAAQVQTPEQIRVQGHYLVDAITSASIATGVVEDVQFTEIRHDGGVGLGYEFDLGDKQLDVTINGRLSIEPDYTSTGIQSSTVLALAQRQTLVGLQFAYVHDDVSSVLRSQNSTERVGRVGSFDALNWGMSVERVLTRTVTLSAGYQLGRLTGYLANPYRSVTRGGAPEPETHPRRRIRNTIDSRLSWHIPQTSTTAQLSLRAYRDSWDIQAISPELRIYQRLAPSLLVRGRYRGYVQSRANFQKSEYDTSDTFFTQDPKMTAFQTHLLGGQIIVPLRFLERTPLGFASEASADLSFERYWNTNRFGHGVIAQAGLIVPL